MNKALYNQFIVLLTSRLLQTNKVDIFIHFICSCHGIVIQNFIIVSELYGMVHLFTISDLFDL
jgi:hypothetical protein